MRNAPTDNCSPNILDDLELVGDEPGFTCYPWPTTPTDYLAFAEVDLAENSRRSLINSISHAKRAIHAHVDFLLYNCRQYLRNAPFPQKIELLKRLGIVAPSLLIKYNNLRNLIEHEYLSPTSDEAREVLDVAQLFIEATRCYTSPLPQTLIFMTVDKKQTCVIQCNWDDQVLLIQVTPPDKGECGTCVVTADSSNGLWHSWVSRILRLMQDARDPYVKCDDSEMIDKSA